MEKIYLKIDEKNVGKNIFEMEPVVPYKYTSDVIE